MDGNAPNMFHGNDSYFRYDGTGGAGGPPQPPRPMGPPPGAYARHRGPHPGMQQQPVQGQYPGYQPPDNMYGMAADPQAMAGMNEMGAWGGAAAQASPYGAPGMGAYNHPQMQQHQRQPQAGYRQHMSGYPQQDPKMQYPVQQNVMGGMVPGQGGYGPTSAATQQQNPAAQAQRGVPPHYPQSHGGMGYPGAQAQASVAQSPYGAAAGYHPQHQAVSRAPPHHIGYGHTPMVDQAYGQHAHHLGAGAQQQQQQPQQQPANNHMQQQQQQQSQQGQHQQSHVPTPQVHGLGSMHSAAQQHLVGHHSAHQQQQQQQQQQQGMHGNVQPQQQQQPPHSAAAYSAHMSGGYGVVPPVVSQQQQAQQSPVPQQQHQQSAMVGGPQQSVPQPYLPSGKPLAAASNNSPQYRAPFPQLSPQMSSPRPQPPQISPHPQMSPRPVMSPAKPPVPSQQQTSTSLSPHPHIPGVASPRPGGPQAQQAQSTAGGKNNSPVTTLQALEQMVMPGAAPVMPMNPMEYSQGSGVGVAAGGGYRQHPGVMNPNNPLSPMGPRMPMSPQQQQQQQWAPPPMATAVHRQGQHASMYPMPQQQQQGIPPQQQQGIQQLGQQQQPQQQQHPITSQHMMSDLMGMSLGGYGGVAPGAPPGLQEQSLGLGPQMPSVNVVHQQQQQQQQQQHQSQSQVVPPPVVLQHSIDNQLNTPHQIGTQQQQSLGDVQMAHQQQQQQQQQANSMANVVLQQEKTMNTQQQAVVDPMSTLNQMTSHQPQQIQPNADHLLMDPFATMDSTAASGMQQLQPTAASDNGIAGGQQQQNQHQQQMSLESSLGIESLQQQQQESNNGQMNQMKESVEVTMKGTVDQSQSLMSVSGDDNQLGDVFKEKDQSQYDDQGLQSSNNNAGLMHEAQGNNEMQGQQQQQQTSYDSQSDNSQSSMHQTISNSMELNPCQTEITSTDQKMHDVQTKVVDAIAMQPPQMVDPQVTQPQAQQTPSQPLIPDNMIGGYGLPTPTPLPHHQERGMIQQQLQELYCLLPGPETQEKIHRLQERMNVLQQHEINEQCNGGSHCSLQPQVYVPPMIDSPQVSSTTGRGRGRGISKPRKPRQKKGEKQFQGDASESSPIESSTTTSYATNSLPVSEDCVTPGAGLTDIPPEIADADGSDEDGENSQDKSFEDGEAQEKAKKRKSKKGKEGKPPKEKKKKEPKKSGGGKKKKGRKSDESELDSTIDASMDTAKIPDDDTNVPDEGSALEKAVEPVETDGGEGVDEIVAATTSETTDEKPATEDITDFDDIPVSKIPIAMGETEGENADAQKGEDGDEGYCVTPASKKKRSGGGSSRSSASRRSRPSSSRKPPSSKSKSRRSRMITESDGEGEDMLATPPASPTDGDLDSSKRRSARNTQRKKYIDDVMLRFSDDDNELTSPSTSKKERKATSSSATSAAAASAATGSDGAEVTDGGAAVVTTTDVPEPKEVEPVAEDFGGKPNYVYVNTTDEDSMVVQLILAMRIGKRELKPEPPPAPPAPHVVDEVKSEDVDIKKEDGDEDNLEKETNTTIEHNVEGEEEKQVATEGEEVDKDKKIEEETTEALDEKREEESETPITETTVDELAKDESKEKSSGEEKMDTEVSEEKPKSPMVDKPSVESIPEEEAKMETEESETKPSEDAEIEKVSEETPKEVSVPEEKPLATSEPMETSEGVDKPEDDSTEKTEEVKSEAKISGETETPGTEVKTETTEETPKVEEENKPEPVFVEVEEYFVKYRNFSYLHCEWRTEEELTKGDRRVAAKIKRFLQKQSSQINIFENIEDEPFNPDFTEVDRVLDMSEHKDAVTGDTTKHYLVKWKSLPYEDCTWELEEDVDHIKIEQFERFTKLPPRSEWKSKKRPHPDLWKKLDKSPIYKAGNSLRPYQLEGLNWLKFSWFNSHNCILADEMGLGKTIQSLTFIHSIWEWGIRGPFLVIAPLSTIPNWQREFEGWTDMNIIVYHGSGTSKQMLQEYEFYYKNDNGKVIKDLTKFNVLITTFEMIVTDYADLKQFNWRACVIDEAHRLKNRNCKLLEGLRQLNLEHRVLLSGTPLQNNVSELFSLLNFLEPNQFGSSEEFTKEFGSLKTESEVQKLQALLKPMMLRRLKDDVEKSLAPKEETLVEVELTNIQKKYYRGILEQNFSFLSRGTSAANIPNLMNTMMELRKCCIHPYLLNGAEENIQYDHNLQHGVDPDAYYKNLVNSSGKMVLLDKLLPKLKANGHRVLIFSQMVRCLDLLEDYLMYKKYPFERIDGRIRGDLRQAAIDRYSKPDSDRFVFLLCTKAGGLGINLTAADTVIIYDSDWNPQNDLQAQARCHRIGQQKMVKIYRLLCRNTYEREMFDKASLKLGLDKAILQSMNTTQGKETNAKQMSKKEIEDLLKKGAYGAIMDEDAGDKFCEEDIDSILQRRTQVITMESEKGSTFSKASFAMSGNRSDINIDDPDFWKKWAKRADIDPTLAERDEKEDLVLLEPRRRTQIKRFGHDDGVGVDISEDSLSDSAEEGGGVGSRMKRRRERREKKRRGDDKEQEEYVPREPGMGSLVPVEEVAYGNWNRTECFKVEKGLLSFGWGRWPEILEQGSFKKTWRDMDVEELARIILLYCLRCYKGDEKIKNFIWDLIAPVTEGEDAASFRNHSGLHNLVPRGRNAKGRQGNSKATSKEQAGSSTNSNASSPREKQSTPGTVAGKEMEPGHWSLDEKYDCEAILDGSYKKHLARHANKVLLRVRMLFYIKHEIIGDYVQQIAEGVNVRNFGDPMVLSYINKSLLRDLPIRPPLTSEQMPSTWWIPNCCDKSLLVGTYKHGCENYQEIRSDSTLCFITHIGLPPEDNGGAAVVGAKAPATTAAPVSTNMEDGEVKMDDIEELDEDGNPKGEPKPSTSAADAKSDLDRPASSGLEDDDVIITGTVPAGGAATDDLTWPSMQDLNTRLRRVITSYQRNYKKEELRAAQQQKQAKIQASMASSSPLVVPSGSSSASSTPTPSGVAANMGSGAGNQTQTQAAQQSTTNASSAKPSTNANPLTSQIPGMSSAVDMLLSLGFGINPNDPAQLANIDINKLAMYLQKFGSKEQLEKQMRDRERMRLQQSTKKWTRRDENEFLRVLTCYGIDLLSNTSATIPNWTRFKAMAKLEKKSDDAMSDYYKVFIAMCKRQAGVKLLDDEKGLENMIEDISEDHARLILDRLELLSKLREVIKSNKLDDRLKLCKNNYDTPDWWEPGKHDAELIKAILKHGLHKSEQQIMNDPMFSFRDSCAEYEHNIQVYNQNAMLKLEDELLKMKAASAVLEKVEANEKEEVSPTTAMETVAEEKTESVDEPEKEIEEDDDVIAENNDDSTEAVKPESPEVEQEVTNDKEEEEETTSPAEVKDKESVEKDLPEDGGDKEESEEPTSEVTESKTEETEKPKSPEAIPEKVAESENQTVEEEKDEGMDVTEESTVPTEEVKAEVSETSSEEKVTDEALVSTESEQEEKENDSSEKEEKMEVDEAEPKLSTEEELKDSSVEKLPEDVTQEEIKASSPAPASPKTDKAPIEEEDANEEADKPAVEDSDIVPETISTEEKIEPKPETVSTEEKSVEKMDTDSTEEKETVSETTTEATTETAEPTEKEGESVETKEADPVETSPEKEPAEPSEPTLPTVALPKIDLMSDLKLFEEQQPSESKVHEEELKSRFPDLEVTQSAKSSTTDEDVVEVKPALPKLMEKQLLIRWFRDFALEKRVSHIIYCVEKNDWPVGKSYSAYTGCQGMDLDVPLFETIKRIPMSESATAVNPDIITINTDQGLSSQLNNSLLQSLQSALGGVPKGGVTLTPTSHQMGQAMGNSPATQTSGKSGAGKGRKRHIAIDVETERAKLHALLNNTPTNQSSTKWLEEELKESSRRGNSGHGGAASSLQPPPAHQAVSRSQMNAAATAYNKTTIIPGTSSTLTPIDLSSSFPKVNMADMLKNPIDLSEVQDFSISSKMKSGGGQSNVFGMQMGGAGQGGTGGGSGKGSKLDSMLSKLMKKNNVPVPAEDAPMGKANKKRKLDEIVMGLSSAQEQKMYPDPMLTPSSHRKTQITPSVSVTPANAVAASSQASNQKPFTITVTSVPATGQDRSSSSSSSKQQQQQLLQQQQQQQQSQKHNNPLSGASGLAALQSMAGLGGASSKELNAYLAEAAKAEQQALLKQHQKLLQQLPANSPHRKAYEAMYNEMKQMADLSQLYNQKLGNYSGQDAKVNKWLAEHQQSMDNLTQVTATPTTPDYGSRGGRGQRATRQSQQPSASSSSSSAAANQQIQQKQDAVLSRFSLTGEETVPVIHKISGKRLTGNKAPQLKRITQWLAENPAYEIDPKWLELAQMPMAAPSPKPSPSAESTSSSSSAKTQQQQSRSAASSSAAAMAQMANQYQSQASSSAAASKKQRASEVAALNAAMQFPGLQGLNPQLLSQLGANFDPKNPLSMLPFAGMTPGLGNLGNVNNMNMLASLAGLSGLGNMDANTLATMMTASGLDANTLAALTASMSGQLAGIGGGQQGSSSGSGGNSRQSSSGGGGNKGAQSGSGGMSSGRGSKGKSDASSGQGGSGSSSSGKGGGGGANSNQFPFLFTNPNMMYPLGLNPYALNPNMSPYDQLAQYSLLNGGPGGAGGAGTSSTAQSPRQGGSSQGKSQSGSSGSGRGGQSSSSSSSAYQQGGSGGSSKGQSRSSAAAAAAAAASLASGSMSRADLNHLQSLLPHDPMLLESLGRVAAGLDITRSSGSGGGGSVEKKSRESSSAKEAERRKQQQHQQQQQQQQAESMSRSSNFPMDMATIQALAQGKLPASLAKASAKDLQMLAQLPPELSQAFLLEMAQAAGMNLGGLPGMAGLGGGSSSQSSGGGGERSAGQGGGGGRGEGGSSSSSSSSSQAAMKRALEQDLRDLRDLENLNKAQMEMLARNLGMSSSISLIPTAGGASSGHGEEKVKRSRTSDSGSSRSSQQQQSVGAQLKQQTDEAAAAFAMAMAEAKMRSAMQQSMSGAMGGGGGGERSRDRSRDRDSHHHSSSSSSSQRKSSSEERKERHEAAAAIREEGRGGSSAQSSASSSSVMNLSSLPSQTTITLASPGSAMKSPGHGGMSGEREHQGTASDRGGSEGSSKSYKDRSDYDLEDLIAPSKVNKSGSMAADDDDGDEGNSRRDDDENGGGGSGGQGRRTRGKRPRSGDDLETMMGGGGMGGGVGPPERKRELRSSAGRAAAAAAARIAAEAKAAAAAGASANTSGGSSDHQHMSEEERDHART